MMMMIMIQHNNNSDPNRPVPRCASRADSFASSHGSRHRREQATLPPVTDIYCTTHVVPSTAVPLYVCPQPQRALSLLRTTIPLADDDNALFELSSSDNNASVENTARGRRNTNNETTTIPDWMVQWANQESTHQLLQQQQHETTSTATTYLPTKPVPTTSMKTNYTVLFSAGWAAVREDSKSTTRCTQDDNLYFAV